MAYNERIVAFIDILGFKAAVNESVQNEIEWLRIKDTLEDLYNTFVENKHQPSKQEIEEMRVDTQIIQASDSLIISRPIDEKGGLRSMILDCMMAIHTLIDHGFLCRGSIESGDLYHTSKLMFGPAFIKAYEKESEETRPIIKFHKNLLDVPKKFPGQEDAYGPDNDQEDINKNCKLLENEEYYYIDYFSNNPFNGSGPEEEMAHYSNLREIIVNGLTNMNEKIQQKYTWAAHEFNSSPQGQRLHIP